jgi:hypothetical protein
METHNKTFNITEIFDTFNIEWEAEHLLNAAAVLCLDLYHNTYTLEKVHLYLDLFKNFEFEILDFTPNILVLKKKDILFKWHYHEGTITSPDGLEYFVKEGKIKKRDWCKFKKRKRKIRQKKIRTQMRGTSITPEQEKKIQEIPLVREMWRKKKKNMQQYADEIGVSRCCLWYKIKARDEKIKFKKYYYPVVYLAELLGCHRVTLFNYIKQGKLTLDGIYNELNNYFMMRERCVKNLEYCEVCGVKKKDALEFNDICESCHTQVIKEIVRKAYDRSCYTKELKEYSEEEVKVYLENWDKAVGDLKVKRREELKREKIPVDMAAKFQEVFSEDEKKKIKEQLDLI